MKKVLEYVKQYWLTVIFGIGFILLYKYISDNLATSHENVKIAVDALVDNI